MTLAPHICQFILLSDHPGDDDGGGDGGDNDDDLDDAGGEGIRNWK